MPCRHISYSEDMKCVIWWANKNTFKQVKNRERVFLGHSLVFRFAHGVLWIQLEYTYRLLRFSQ